VPFNKYFQDELSYLRELGREFSSAYPALAPMLADRGGDPDVERLLEGVAFLTGRIRQKLDDELPELMFAVASLLFPQIVRPLPSAAILEITPLPNVLRDARVVAAGSEFCSVKVDGTSCRFRSCTDCEIAPWTLDTIRLETLAGGAHQLRLELSSGSAAMLQVLPSKLRLHLAGDDRNSQTLLAWMTHHVESVALVEPQLGGTERSIELDPAVISAAGFAENESLLPATEAAFPGFRLLAEYYMLPAKFAFVDIAGLRRIEELNPDLTRVGVLIRFDMPLPMRQVSADDVKLHCVPVINLFETTADPIRVVPGREQHLLRAAGLQPTHGDVYAIRKVETVSRGSSERLEIPPFFDFSHAASMNDDARIYYTTHTRPSVVGDGADVYIALGSPENSGITPQADVLSIDLLASNGSLAKAVRAGEINVATSSSPPYASFRNLRAVTPHVPPPLGHELQWRVTAHAAMNLRALTEPEVLRTALGVYNLHAIVDRQAARANELRIQAIKDVRVKPTEKLFRGAAIRGISVEIDLDDSGFAGDGDLCLFGSVMERFFAEYVSINSFSRTSVKSVRSNLVFSWPARSGNQTLL
jgi:type VI secretion system protein ImpG